MGLLIKGISKLSELEIDADKVWVDLGAIPHGITNIKEVAALMARGDLAVRGDTVLVRIQPGADGYVLTSTGLGKIPVWMPAGGSLKYYFPVWIYLTDAEAIVAVNRTDDEPADLDTSHSEAYDDQPASLVLRRTPILSGADDEAIVVVNESDNEPANIGRDISIAIDGAV
jgi:hypothetical protein